MKTLIQLSVLCLVVASGAAMFAQDTSQSPNTAMQENQNTATDAQKNNVDEYIELLRSNVRDQKAQIMGAIMQLDVDESKQFWTIYSDYDAELKKLNDLRVQNIEDYAKNYNHLTGTRADILVKNAFNYQRQRSELLAKYYDRVKASLGPIQAARFVQVENQLLMIVDLQIASSLPIVAEGSGVSPK